MAQLPKQSVNDEIIICILEHGYIFFSLMYLGNEGWYAEYRRQEPDQHSNFLNHKHGYPNFSYNLGSERKSSGHTVTSRVWKVN